MTPRQSHYFGLALLVAILTLIFLIYAIAPAPAQELPRYPLLRHQPEDKLAPLSCRDQVAHNRNLILAAAPLQTTKQVTHNYLAVAKLLRSLKTIDHVCSRPDEMRALNIWGAIAESQIVNNYLAGMTEQERLNLIGPRSQKEEAIK